MARQGHAVEVVAAGPGVGRDGEIPVRRIDADSLFYRGGAPEALAESWRARAAVPSFVGRLTFELARRAGDWDAIISHWLLPCSLVAAARGLPHLAVAHSGDVALLARLPGARAVARLLATRVTDLVFVSEDLRRRFGELVGREVGRVVPMGVEAAQPTPPPTGRFTVLFLGRLVPIKGLDVLLQAAAALPESRFILAGEGPERERLARALPTNAELCGSLGGPAKARALAQSHVVCVPSIELLSGRTEGAPVVVTEALAAGRPVVASRTGGLPETVGDAGLLVPPGDPAALALALARLSQDPVLYARLCASARDRGASRTWDTVAPALLARLCPALPPTLASRYTS
jgi:glycosyltransferase involved in cell wall biosynthesis